jgi:hypothetical protein
VSTWIQTVSGKKMDLLNPAIDSINIEDIAYALSRICRFNGHTRRGTWYSVAEHSVNVAMLVPDEHKLTALMHDASEAYIADLSRPIKSFIKNYEYVEHRLMMVISRTFGNEWPLPKVVKDIDMRILNDEKRDIMGPEPEAWDNFGEPMDFPIYGMHPQTAERAFLTAFDLYTTGKVGKYEWIR